ncbi:MAG: 2-oxoacid:acceptor oxidoreductase family protein [Sedimentisphaerales bacterium]|nr:2-oxoacid:acceptor oxidoreductase family protein [Sedimentisphaerales bacterium]
MMAGNFLEEVIIAGFGGQGVILAGKLLTQTAMKKDLKVSYIPAYGPEVRGGTANCMVVISDESVACPLVVSPTSLIVMNKASLLKFTPALKSGGLMVMNRTLIDVAAGRDDITLLEVPADDIALKLDNPRGANMVALGAYVTARGILTVDDVAACMPDVLAKRYHDTLEANIKTLKAGAAYIREHYDAVVS